jgi:hypothetical protein
MKIIHFFLKTRLSLSSLSCPSNVRKFSLSFLLTERKKSILSLSPSLSSLLQFSPSLTDGFATLHEPANTGDAVALTRLLSFPHDINERDESGVR